MPPLFNFDQLKSYTTGYFEMKNLLLMVRFYSIHKFVKIINCFFGVEKSVSVAQSNYISLIKEMV